MKWRYFWLAFLFFLSCNVGIQYKILVPDIHNKFVRLPGRLVRLGGFLLLNT